VDCTARDWRVTLALCLFAAALLIAIRDAFPERSLAEQATADSAHLAIAFLSRPGLSIWWAVD
jgi:hypothetical protein